MAKQPELTDWYPPEIKPVRIGPYLRDYGRYGCEWFSWWNGEEFSHGSVRPQRSREISFHQDLPWRGLARKP